MWTFEEIEWLGLGLGLAPYAMGMPYTSLHGFHSILIFHICTSIWVYVWIGHKIWTLSSQYAAPVPGPVCRPWHRLSRRDTRYTGSYTGPSGVWPGLPAVAPTQPHFVPFFIITLVYICDSFWPPTCSLPYMLIPRWHVCSNKILFYQKAFYCSSYWSCLNKKFLVRFSSNTYLYILFGKPFASSYSNHCCAWLCG